jgi:hypothetical protein
MFLARAPYRRGGCAMRRGCCRSWGLLLLPAAFLVAGRSGAALAVGRCHLFLSVWALLIALRQSVAAAFAPGLRAPEGDEDGEDEDD